MPVKGLPDDDEQLHSLILPVEVPATGTSDATARLGSPAARLRQLSGSKRPRVAQSGSEPAEPIKIGQSCGITVLLVFMVQIYLLTVN